MGIASSGKQFTPHENPREFLKQQLISAKCLELPVQYAQRGSSMMVIFPEIPPEYANILRIELVEMLARHDKYEQDEEKRQAHFKSMETTPQELTELRKIRDSVLFIKSLFK